MNINNEIPKYRKKSKSTNKAKSDHKHEYTDCLLFDGKSHWKGTYCKICGKIGDRKWETEPIELHGKMFHRLLHNEELVLKYKDLNVFNINSDGKYIEK